MSKSSKKRPAPTGSVRNQPPAGPVKPAETPVAARPAVLPRPAPPVAAVLPPAPVVTAAPAPVAADQPFELIRFDGQVKWFLGICATVFVLLVLAKINYSSIAIWNQILPDGADAKRGLVTGTPRQIRMDDWAGATPMTMSQVNNDFPLANQALGGEKPSLVCGVPNKHFSTIFRLENVGYLFLGLERGFAWEWNYFVFAGLISVFLLLLALTRNQFWLSVLGAFWVVLSPGIAWWSMVNLGFVYSGCLLLLASLAVFYARSVKTLLWAGPVYVWALGSFALFMYPPYLVPFGYLLILMLAGFIWRHNDRALLFSNLWLKLGTFALAAAVTGALLFAYYTDAKDTLEVMSGTVYPGQRSEVGGTGFVANWLSEYFSGWLLTDQRIPPKWMNICELSHFVTLTPVIAVCLGVYFVKTRRVDPMLTMMIVYVAVLMIWMQLGFPKWLAKATLIDMSPTRRTQVPLGLANVFIAILYLAYIRGRKIDLGAAVSALLWAGVVAFMIYAAWLNVTDSDGFYKAHQLFVPVLFFIGLNGLLLPSVRFRGKEIVVAAGLVAFSLPSLKINPIGKGMAPITENAFYRKVDELHKQDPKARWAVFGSQYLTYMVTATGANQLSGMKYMPDYPSMKVLDPAMKRDSAYNRFAHVVYASYIDPAHPDSVIIFNQFEDAYTVAMDGCSPRFKTLNTKYIVFDKEPQPVEVRCMNKLADLGSIKIYKRNDF
jgi:hypothetical protein